MYQRKVSIFLTACLLLAIGTFSSAAYAFELSGIPPSGQPSFWNKVTIDMNDNAGRLHIKGRGDFNFEDGSTNWLGEKVIYKLQAFYNDSGDFLSGNVQIKGGIAGLGIDKGTTLATMDIIDWNLTQDPNLWGFATDNIVCNPLLLVACTLKESVYVQLLGANFDGKFDNGKFYASGFAVTTVPVPAAAWLFGSALVLMGWIRRRKTLATT